MTGSSCRAARVVLAVVAPVAFVAGLAGQGSDASLAARVGTGDVVAVRQLLAGGADVHARAADGSTALHVAARVDHPEMVALLVSAGADVTAKTRYGVTPVYEAALNGSSVVLEALLRAGADPNATVGDGETALMTAARTGSAAAVETLLARGAHVDTIETWRGQSALMWAAAENHAAVVRVLLEHGADISGRSRTTEGRARGRPGGPPATPPPPTGGLTPLLFAARQGAMDAARTLVDMGAPVDETAPDGTSPLLVAILNDHTDLARFLLERGANPNIVNYVGTGPLYAAVNMRNLEHSARPAPPGLSRDDHFALIQALIARGANVNARLARGFPNRGGFEFSWVDLDGATPFVRAAKSSDVPVMRLLLEHGADPHTPTSGRRGANTTAFMMAAGVNFVDLQTRGSVAEALDAMALCLERGADVNAVNDAGVSALHGAAFRGSVEMVEFLVARGARLDAKDNRGWTPLTYAEGVHIHGGSPQRNDGAVDLLMRLMTERGIPIEVVTDREGEEF